MTHFCHHFLHKVLLPIGIVFLVHFEPFFVSFLLRVLASLVDNPTFNKAIADHLKVAENLQIYGNFEILKF